MRNYEKSLNFGTNHLHNKGVAKQPHINDKRGCVVIKVLWNQT